MLGTGLPATGQRLGFFLQTRQTYSPSDPSARDCTSATLLLKTPGVKLESPIFGVLTCANHSILHMDCEQTVQEFKAVRKGDEEGTIA